MATDVGSGSKYAYDDIETENDYDPPYRVLFPGQHRKSSSSSFSKDPRLGAAQKLKDKFIKHHKKWGQFPFDFDAADDDDEFEDDNEWEDDDEWEPVPLTEEEEMRASLPCRIIQSSEGSHIDRLSKSSRMEWEKKYYQQWKNKIKTLEKYEANYLKNRDCKCAEAAIEFYNKKHGTDYEIVETLGSYSSMYIGFWFHCNFRAQRKSDAGQGHRPKLFFAELHLINPKLVVKHCQILHRHRHSSRVVRGCKICPNQLCHPIDKCRGEFKRR